MTHSRTIRAVGISGFMLAGVALAQGTPMSDLVSVLGGPKVKETATAPTGGSFGEPGARQMTERASMGVFVRAVRSLNDPDATYGETIDKTPPGVGLSREQLAEVRAVTRAFQEASLAAMRGAGLSKEDVSALTDTSADPERRKALAQKVRDATGMPDPAAAQEKIYALLSGAQRPIVERRIELWRAQRYANTRGEAIERSVRDRMKEQPDARSDDPERNETEPRGAALRGTQTKDRRRGT